MLNYNFVLRLSLSLSLSKFLSPPPCCFQAIRSKIMKKNELVVNKISISEQVSPDIEQMMIIKCLSSEWSLETACYCKFSKTFMYKMLSMKTGFCENINFQILVMEILKTEL